MPNIYQTHYWCNKTFPKVNNHSEKWMTQLTVWASRKLGIFRDWKDLAIKKLKGRSWLSNYISVSPGFIFFWKVETVKTTSTFTIVRRKWCSIIQLEGTWKQCYGREGERETLGKCSCRIYLLYTKTFDNLLCTHLSLVHVIRLFFRLHKYWSSTSPFMTICD